MLGDKPAPKDGENFWLWFLKIFSGLLVIVLLFVHLAVNHFMGNQGLLTFHEVVAYLSHPWVAAMEIAFLIIVISHALMGTRSIILDFKPAPSLVRALNWTFLGIGLLSIGYGVWLIRVVIYWGSGG
jgi:succinate dehydrogenase / fumarate reductase membrane anchor subunit